MHDMSIGVSLRYVQHAQDQDNLDFGFHRMPRECPCTHILWEIKVPTSNSSAFVPPERLCVRTHHPCVGRVPSRYHLSTHDRQAVACDWLAWQLLQQAPLLPTSTLALASFPIFLRPHLSHFPHSFPSLLLLPSPAPTPFFSSRPPLVVDRYEPYDFMKV